MKVESFRYTTQWGLMLGDCDVTEQGTRLETHIHISIKTRHGIRIDAANTSPGNEAKVELNMPGGNFHDVVQANNFANALHQAALIKAHMDFIIETSGIDALFQEYWDGAADDCKTVLDK